MSQLQPPLASSNKYPITYSKINEAGRREYTPASFLVDELLNPNKSRESLGYSRVSMREKTHYQNTDNLYRPLK